ncbi:DUF2188 domain-containing protein [Imperialibacter roseus]|uniref:DUF2188 domain-containing protein n=1 Tax=Imperialibacter roseus TaxID=1324217 RepID=A0ABZ0IV75_9BACT|nr:DUF2188 domain-containing protein [Imperialibacter roseus]WOK08412.1 DUF2188 domain-containing protein [Imperialibacter roseus]
MARKSNHVVPSTQKGGWAVKKSGSAKSSKSFDNKVKAVEYGKQLSKKEHSELFIHRKDGTIQNRNSYGNDPFPPKDRKH